LKLLLCQLAMTHGNFVFLKKEKKRATHRSLSTVSLSRSHRNLLHHLRRAKVICMKPGEQAQDAWDRNCALVVTEGELRMPDQSSSHPSFCRWMSDSWLPPSLEPHGLPPHAQTHDSWCPNDGAVGAMKKTSSGRFWETQVTATVRGMVWGLPRFNSRGWKYKWLNSGGDRKMGGMLDVGIGRSGLQLRFVLHTCSKQVRSFAPALKIN